MMKEEYTIKGSDLEKVFESLKLVKINTYLFEKNEDKTLYEKFLSEFVSLYCAIIQLGLEDEWQKWQMEYDESHIDK